MNLQSLTSPIPLHLHLRALGKRIRAHVRPAAHPALWFWLAFLVGNGLLFLPYPLLTPQRTQMLPLPGRDIRSVGDLLQWRGHMDLLRVYGEWVLLVTVWVLWSPRWGSGVKRVFRVLLPLLFGLMLVYQGYAAVMWELYHNQPNLYNDVPFIIGGLRFVLEAFHPPLSYYVLLGGALVGLLLLVGGTLYVILFAVPADALGRTSRGLLVALSVLVLGQGILYRSWLADPRWAVHSFTADIAANVQASLRSREAVQDLTRLNPYTLHDYTHYTLKGHPNVYLIFVESYGSILYSDPFYRERYRSLMHTWQARLEARGWHMVSSLSESPTWGGGSWLAYTSAMFGLRIPQHVQYLALREKYQVLPYPNLGRFLHSKGYDYVWVVPITRKLSPRETEENHRFYGADRWITFEDLDYHGPLYGWGPSPPDQFTLGYIGEFARHHEGPLFLFFLTQSSHYPWVPLPPVVDDWRTLATAAFRGGSQAPEETDRLPFTQLRENYWQAIAYDLNMLGDFLLHLEDENALVILIGDHQPPAVSARSDGYATPIHVLSRDSGWLEEFRRRGFRPGLWLENPQVTMGHEDVYEMIVMDLVKR